MTLKKRSKEIEMHADAIVEFEGEKENGVIIRIGEISEATLTNVLSEVVKLPEQSSVAVSFKKYIKDEEGRTSERPHFEIKVRRFTGSM